MKIPRSVQRGLSLNRRGNHPRPSALIKIAEFKERPKPRDSTESEPISQQGLLSEQMMQKLKEKLNGDQPAPTKRIAPFSNYSPDFTMVGAYRRHPISVRDI